MAPSLLNMLLIYIVFIIAAYFLGALPFLELVGRLKGLDLSQEQDLHAYFFNQVGKVWGIAAGLVDALKGVIPVLAGLLVGFPVMVTVLAALAAIAGQMWPVFNGFDGERGNTIAAGVVATFCLGWGAPLALLIAICIVLVGLLIRIFRRWRERSGSVRERIELGGRPSNIFPLAVIIGFASFIPASLAFQMDIWITWGFSGVLILLLVRRLTGGLLSDLKKPGNPSRIIINRLLFDRSET